MLGLASIVQGEDEQQGGSLFGDDVISDPAYGSAVSATQKLINAAVASDPALAAAAKALSSIGAEAIKADGEGGPTDGRAVDESLEALLRGLRVALEHETIAARCGEYEGFSTLYLSILLGIIAIGLTLSLFLVVIIGWYPDLYTSKHISQGYCLLSNLITLSSMGFIVLSTFIPTERLGIC